MADRDQLQGFVGELAADAHLPQQVEVGIVQLRREQFAHLVVFDAGLNQFEQDSLVFLLADDQPAVAQQVADQQHRLLGPGLGHETGGPHRQERPTISSDLSFTPSQ